MTKPPQTIGDVPRFVINITPPADDPSAVATAVQVIVKPPSGSEFVADPSTVTSLADNQWLYEATDPVDEAGSWVWRVNVTAGLRDSFEVAAVIARSPFTSPLP